MDECKLYLAEDGSLVDDEDYFITIEPQALFIVAKKDEVVKTGMSACAKKSQGYFMFPGWWKIYIALTPQNKTKLFLNGWGIEVNATIFYIFNEIL